MTMTITEANAVNTVLRHVLNLPDGSGSVPDNAAARDAAAHLAGKAHAVLSAGLTATSVAGGWPADDEDSVQRSTRPAAAVSSYALRPHVEEAERRLRASDYAVQEHRPGEFEDALRFAMHEAAVAQVHATLALVGTVERVYGVNR